MKTFFQLREETTGKTLKVSKDIYEAAQQMMNEGTIDPGDHEDRKEAHDYHKEMAEDDDDYKIAKDHYRGEGDRGGVDFSYKHGKKYGASDHEHGDSLASIHKGVKASNPHLDDHEVTHTAKTIHNHLSSQDY